jgi:hypothetical protein
LAEVPREPNGKFRAVICRISAEEQSLLRSTGVRDA